MSTKQPILFICHRIPFPPNKGDKITTFNLMKFLSERYDLYLGCFIDDEFDLQYKDDVSAFCKEAYFVDITMRKQASSGIRSLLTKKPVSISHYTSPEMQNWVDSVIQENDINNLFAYSSGMAQFIESSDYKNKNRVLDMADIDSDKWRQYAENKPFYSAWIYNRECQLLEKYEQRLLSEFSALTLITDEERDLFKTMSPEQHHTKIITLSNGVDTEYFNPEASYDYTDKPNDGEQLLCFTGAMDYWANADAVVWFCEHVWPAIHNYNNKLKFYIVGGNPTEQVKKLGSSNGIVVTGRVVDVRPYVAQSLMCVAPLRIARGVQNKVLEAMAMAKPVVMTAMAQEGIQVSGEQHHLVTDDPQPMIQAIIKLLENNDLSDKLGTENRNWIVEQYSWQGALSKLDDLFPRGKL